MATGRDLAALALLSLSLTLLLTCASSVGRSEAEERMVYHDWIARHRRAFGVDFNRTTDDDTRFNIFLDNLRYIDAHNARAGVGYRLGLTAFTGLSHEEFSAQYIHGATPPAPVHDAGTTITMADIPRSVDWRTAGAVAPVKSQGQCGSCWAFSAISSVESAVKLDGGDLVPLSEQEVIDCVRTDGSKGCHGGYVNEAFDFIAAKGACSQDSYPYTGSDEAHCTACPKAASIAGFERVAANDEAALMVAVARQPVSVLIEGSGRNFQHYSSGVFTGACGTSIDHAIVAVGYGGSSDVETDNFWIMRNSWSTDWGEEGYVRMSRSGGSGGAGLCGLAMFPTYPIVRRA